jgi:hypothetical protein
MVEQNKIPFRRFYDSFRAIELASSFILVIFPVVRESNTPIIRLRLWETTISITKSGLMNYFEEHTLSTLSGGIGPPFFALTLNGGEFHAPASIHPGERATDTHWIWGWVGPSRSGRYGEKNLALPGIEPWPSSPSLDRLSYPGASLKVCLI